MKMGKVRKLDGMGVITEDSCTIGEISGVEVDTTAWQIIHQHVELTKDVTKRFGFRKPLLGHVTVCLPTRILRSIEEVIPLDQQLEKRKDLLECSSRNR